MTILKLRYVLMFMLLVYVPGCADPEPSPQTASPCGQADTLVVGDETVCVIGSGLLVETGFSCPASHPNGHSYAEMVVCSEGAALPSGFFEAFEAAYPESTPEGPCHQIVCALGENCVDGVCASAPVDPMCTLEPDGFEPNDDAASAAPLAIGVRAEATLCDGEEDWFELIVPPRDTVQIDVAVTGSSLALTLFEDNGQLVDTGVIFSADANGVSASYAGSVSRLLLRATSAGESEYSVLVTVDEWVPCQALSCGDSCFICDPDVCVHPQGPTFFCNADQECVESSTQPDCEMAGECTDDRYEPNDDVASATLYLSDRVDEDLGSGGLAGLSLCGGDVDVFTVEDALAGLNPTMLAAAGVIYVSVLTFDQSDDLSVELLNDSEAVVETAQATNIQDPMRWYGLEYTVPADGTYHVRIQSNGADVETMHLGVLYRPDPTCSPDAYEPNETRATAFALEGTNGSFSATACGTNEDWYAVNLTAGQELTLSAMHSWTEHLEIEIYQGDSQAAVPDAIIGFPGQWGTNPFVAPATDTYYLRMRRADHSPDVFYFVNYVIM